MLRDPGGIRAMSTGKDVIAAAFFRVEGAIVPCTAAFTAAWLGANSQHVGQRIARVGAVAAALPFLGGRPPSPPASPGWACGASARIAS